MLPSLLTSDPWHHFCTPEIITARNLTGGLPRIRNIIDDFFVCFMLVKALHKCNRHFIDGVTKTISRIFLIRPTRIL